MTTRTVLTLTNDDDEDMVFETANDPVEDSDTAVTIRAGEAEWELPWAVLDELHSFLGITRYHRAPVAEGDE